MRSSVKSANNSKKTFKVIKNAHSVAEQREIRDRRADHQGPYLTVAETLVLAVKQAEQLNTQKPVDK